MDPNDFVEIGYFQKPHGYKGQLAAFINTQKEIQFDKLKFLMLDINGRLTPFFIEKIEAKGKVLIKLENCNNEQEAKKFQSKKISIPKEFVTESDETAIEDLVGYTLIDKAYGTVGKIERIEEMPSNDMFVIIKDQKEILLPVTEDLIIEIDDEARTISYEAPEGLIELYLEG